MRTGFVKAAAFAAGVGLLALFPRSVGAENLADALVGAYNTSGLLEQNRALLRAADEDVAFAVSALRPVIDWTASVERQLSDTAIVPASTNLRGTLRLDWLLYDGGARDMAVQATKETVLATRQRLVSIEQQILFRAVAAYMDVILQTETVALRENNVRLLGEELRAAQDRFDVGEVTRTDVALAESRLAAARSNLATARGLLVNAQAEYTNAVGRAPGRLAGQPKLPARPASIDAAEAIAVRNHPDILEGQHRVAAAELTIQRLSSDLGPDARLRTDLGLSKRVGTSGYDDNTSLSLTLSQRIYQGGGLLAQIRRAMANRDSTRAQLLTIQNNVRQEVSRAFVRLQSAQASLAATRERVRAARVAFEGIREEATLGARTTLDVLTAEQDLLNALTAQIEAQSEQSIAAYQLVAAQGLLTAERLGLAVQIYDPAAYYNLTTSAPSRLSRQGRKLNRVLEALGKK